MMLVKFEDYVIEKSILAAASQVYGTPIAKGQTTRCTNKEKVESTLADIRGVSGTTVAEKTSREDTDSEEDDKQDESASQVYGIPVTKGQWIRCMNEDTEKRKG
jgi:hypothetical protein